MSDKHHKKAAFGPSGGGRIYTRDSNPPPMPEERVTTGSELAEPTDELARALYRLREAEAELEKVQWRAERVPDYIDAWNEAQARVERLEAELREAREALTDIVKLGTSYQRYLHRQLPGQPPPDPHYHDEPVYSPEARRARGVLEKDTREHG